MKKQYRNIYTVLLTSIFCNNIYAEPKFLLPFSSGSSFKVSQGVNGNFSHNDKYTRYGWDFVGECLGKPIHASASGVIKYAGYNGGWGNTVVIDYYDYPNNGRYAHLSGIATGISPNMPILQGQLLGYCGNTGFSTGPHLHYQHEDNNYNSVPSSFSDVSIIENGIPITDDIVTSANDYNPYNNFRVGKFFDGWKFENTSNNHFVPYTKPFAVSYHSHDTYINSNLGIYESGYFGYPISDVYKFPDDYQWNSLGSSQVWIQNFNVNGVTYSLVLNPYTWNTRFEYLGVAYPIHGRLRDYWQTYFSVLGPPVTSEYYWPEGTNQYVVQWFEASDNNYISVAYNTSTGNFYRNLAAIPQDSERFNQDRLKNIGCETGCGYGGENYYESDIPGYDVLPVVGDLCNAPYNIDVSMVDNNLTITWDGNNGQIRDHSLELWETNGSQITRETVMSSPFLYTDANLLTGKEYYIKMKTYCSNTISSDWSNLRYFTFSKEDEKQPQSPAMPPMNIKIH